MLIRRAYVTRRAGIIRALAAAGVSALLAGCSVGGGGGSSTPASGSGAAATPAAPAVSGSGAGVEEQAGSGSGGNGSAVAGGSISKGATGKVTGGSTGTYTKSSKSTFSVSHSQLSSSSQSSQYLTPAQAKKLTGQSSTTTTSPAATTSTPASSGKASKPAQTQAPKTRVLVVTRYKVYTRVRTRTITKTVVKTVPPKLPAGAYLPSKHPQLGQPSFTITGANVGCQIAGTEVRCGIRSRAWRAPRQPSGCKSSWGFTIALANRGLPKFVCGGRSPIEAGAKVIPAGWDDAVGNVLCQVRSFGVNCFNAKSRSGFVISRTGYTLY